MVVLLHQLVVWSVATSAPLLDDVITRLVRINLSYIGDKGKRPPSWFRVGSNFLMAMASFTPLWNQSSSLQSTENSRSDLSCMSLATCAENSVPPSVSNWFDPVASVLKSLFFLPLFLSLLLTPFCSSLTSCLFSSWIDADLVAVLWSIVLCSYCLPLRTLSVSPT